MTQYLFVSESPLVLSAPALPDLTALYAANQAFTVWTDSTGGTDITGSILTPDGASAIAPITDSGGNLPSFRGPDNVRRVWIDFGGPTRAPIRGAETDDQLDAIIDDTGLMIRASALPDLTDAAAAAVAAAISAGGFDAAANIYTDTAVAALTPRTGTKAVGQGELFVNVRDYGALGDMTARASGNGTDDTAAILSALAAATAKLAAGDAATLLFPRVPVGYRITSGLVIPVGADVMMYAPVLYDGAGGEAALSIGSPTSAVQNRRSYRLMVQNADSSESWSDPLKVGIAMWAVFHSDININMVQGFTIGARLLGSLAGKGFTYNRVTLGWFGDNKTGLDLSCISTGYCNQNTFIGGSFTVGSTLNQSIDAVGVRITSDDGGYKLNNANHFFGPSFEMHYSTGPGERLPILVENGQRNTFLYIRNEQSSNITIRTKNASSNNFVSMEYADGANLDGHLGIDDQGINPSSILELGDNPIRQRSRRLVARWDNLHRKAGPYAATSVQVPGVNVGTSGVTPDEAIAGTQITITPTYLEVSGSRHLAVFIDTSTVKRFTVFTDADPGYGGRLEVRCYDAAGVVLTSAGPAAPYVQSATTSGGSVYGTTFGGSYRTPVNATGNPDRGFYFAVGANVDHVCLGLSGHTIPLRIRGFSIWTPDVGQVSCYLAAGVPDDVRNYATATPTVGTWTVGREVVNAAPAVGAAKSWICTVAGTPGTWVSTGVL